MKAKYYRSMYQNSGKTILHTISVDNTVTNEAFHVYYMCSVDTRAQDGLGPSSLNTYCQKEIDLLVVSEYTEEVVRQAQNIIAENHVTQVLLPEMKGKELFSLEGALAVEKIRYGEIFVAEKAGWQVKVLCAGDKGQPTLSLLHDTAVNDPKKEDCVLTVRPVSGAMPSEISVDSDNLGSDMKGTLYNDFRICKGHNRKNSTEYVTGTMLLGNGRVDIAMLQTLSVKRQNIRFVTLPDGGKDAAISKSVLEWLVGDDELIDRYFVLPLSVNGNESTIKEILKRGGRYLPMVIGEKWGCQMSGFYVQRSAAV